MAWLPIRYRDFYDIPRAIIVEYRGQVYLLDSPYEDEADEYSDQFTVYRLPSELARSLDEISWENLGALGTEVGHVPAGSIQLDPTRRQYLDDEVFDRVAAREI
jgi:hypothetical protein